MKEAVFISQVCRSKLSQTGWFKTMETYCLTIFEATSLKSSSQKGTKLVRENHSSLLLASGVCQQSHGL